MGELGKLAQKMSPWLRIRPGEEVTVLYKGFKLIPNKFDPTKEVFQYNLMVDNVAKFWETGSPTVAFFFDTCDKGDIVSIKNVGDEKRAKYEMKILVGKNADPFTSQVKVNDPIMEATEPQKGSSNKK